MMHCCRKAFTLVELLIVIAVITVLAALLMPTLQQALENARLVACMDNEKQMGVLFCQYTDEFGGYLPAPTKDPFPGAEPEHASVPNWRVTLNPNKEWDGIFICPGNMGRTNAWQKTPAKDYGMNMKILHTDPCTTGIRNENYWTPKKSRMILRPSRTALVFETIRTEQSGGSVIITSGFAADRIGDFERHYGRSNVLFTDYHSETMFPAEIKYPEAGMDTFWSGR
ncbi:MAG: prepilin-type N-terminal cleavage/methylation domain-containing protein [Planctomycetes bacterium]|nr:prepilin-type N-terminal cleavage/methylation domain-containing protein [Planctomycetota bacterium]